ncbi:uncharacterized protein LOC128809543 [Vidua macroura]|uniref:uncharacterized protein LOC128809543 n=1 Tax=Vidua macroura TaxID=187451 RepID=UPI0023A83318|nr:uncharacterized protein LOC128809543 [Vidua macroura]
MRKATLPRRKMRRCGRMETAATKGWGRHKSSPLLPRGGALGKPLQPGKELLALDTFPVPRSSRTCAVSAGQEKPLNSSHLCPKLWCLSSQTQRAPACTGGPLVLPVVWDAGIASGCVLSSHCRGLPGLNGCTKDRRGCFPSWGSASSRPALPASWDTRREHRGTFLAGSRSPRGLRAALGLRTAPASAPTVTLGCEHSPAGNAPLQAGPAPTLSRRTRGLSCSFPPGKGHGTSTFTSHQENAGKDRKSGLWEEFCVVMLAASQFCPRAIPEPGV